MLRGTFSTTDGLSPAAFNGDFSARRHMPMFGGTTAPKVAIIGDSTALANGNNSVGYMDDLWGYLMTRLREDNPSKTITFGNYAIGGSTLSQTASTGTTLAGAGLSLPSWFSPTSSTWISFVQTFAPDTLFVNFGINDSYTLTTAVLVTFLTAVAGWTKVPDIIFITNKGANAGAGGNYALATYQAGYLNAAAVLRSVSQSNARGFGISNLPNIGFLDVGRVFQMVTNGIDPCVQSLNVDATVSGTTASTFPYLLPATEGDMYLDITFPGQGSAIQAAGGVITITMGQPDGTSTGASNNIQFSSPAASNFYANYYGGASVAVYQNNLNNWAAGDVRMTIHISGSRLYVLTQGTVCLDGQVVRYAGPFVPRIALTNAWANPTCTITTYAAGKARRLRPSLSTLETYGALNGSGNGINHNTSIGLNSIDRWLLQQTDFNSETSSGGNQRTVTAAGAITVTRDDNTIFVNKSVGAATTVNLPAKPIPGRRLFIKDAKGDANVNNITITPASGNIDGSASLVINTAYGYATIAYNGTQWYRVA